MADNTYIPNGTLDDIAKVNNDYSWVRESFNLNSRDAAINNGHTGKRNYNKSRFKFHDTTLGGYRALNPVPQMTRFADIKSRPRSPLSRGMGRYYSEAFDDNAQIIHMRMGVPEFNSVTNFLANMYEPSAGKLARTGEGTTFAGAVGSAAGFLISIPLMPFVWGIRELGALAADIPYNQFYYSKPAMPLYWNAFNTILTKLAINLNLIGYDEVSSKETAETKASSTEGNNNNKSSSLKTAFSKEDMAKLARLMPDIFDEEIGFDIYKIATRYQRLANKQNADIAEISNSANTAEAEADGLYNYYNQDLTDVPRGQSLGENARAYLNSSLAKVTKATKETKSASASESIEDQAKDWLVSSYESAKDALRPLGEWFNEAGDYLEGELTGGSQWVSYKVENTGTISETFSNSVAESPLAAKMNETAAASRAAKFSFAGGNIGDGLIAGALEWATSTATDFVGNVGSSLGLKGIGALLGGGFVEIPKYWENSSADIAGPSYTIKLRPTYGNKISLFKDMYIPLAGILAAALPMSAGPSSYTSPFLIELFDKGRVQTRLGIIDNLSIERFTGNLGSSVDGLPLGIDISFSVIDLHSVMHMPISGESFSFNDQSTYQNYMAVLSGMGPLEQISAGSKFRRKKKILETEFKQFFSPAHFAQWAGDTTIGKVLQAVKKNPDLI